MDVVDFSSSVFFVLAFGWAYSKVKVGFGFVDVDVDFECDGQKAFPSWKQQRNSRNSNTSSLVMFSCSYCV